MGGWERQVFPDGKIVELEKFEDYLLKEPRIGLQVPSLHNLVANLTTMPGGKGVEALNMLRQAIPDLDEKVKIQSVACHVEKLALAEHGGDRKSEVNIQGRDSTLNGKRDNDYLAARIKRDHPEIAERMKRGEFKSVRAAAIEAGIIVPPSNLDLTKRYWLNLNEAERSEFLSWISNEFR